MSKVADIIRAIDHEGASSWEIADEVAALDEIDETTGKPFTLQQVADRIWEERGVEWTSGTLSRYQVTSKTFPDGTRVPSISFRAHVELRAHPDKLLGWKPKKTGDVLTVERARALRGGGSSGKQKPDAWKGRIDRALGVVVEESGNDPAWTIEALSAAITEVERRNRKKLEKVRALLRAV